MASSTGLLKLVFFAILATLTSTICTAEPVECILGIDPPVTGEKAEQAKDATFSPLPVVTDQVMFVYNKHVLTKDGYRVPGDSYLIFRYIGQPPQQIGSKQPVDSHSSYHIRLRNDMVIRSAALAPDHTWVAMTIGQSDGANRSCRLHVINLMTRQMIDVGELRTSLVCWSPDSRFVAYCRSENWNWARSDYWASQLWVFDLKIQKTRQVYHGHTLLPHVDWTVESHLLYSFAPEFYGGPTPYSETPPVNDGVYSITLTGKGKAIYVIPGATQPVISPDGQWIAAFITEGSYPNYEGPFLRQLAIFPRGGGKPIKLPCRDSGDSTEMLWSPDSRHLYYVTGHGPREGRRKSNSMISA